MVDKIDGIYNTIDGVMVVVTFDKNHPVITCDFYREGPCEPKWLAIIGNLMTRPFDADVADWIEENVGNMTKDEFVSKLAYRVPMRKHV